MLNFFFPILDIIFDFWPVLIISAVQGRKNAIRNMTYTWGLWATVKIFLMFSPEPLPSLWISEPLNTLLFSIVGLILISLWIGMILWKKQKNSKITKEKIKNIPFKQQPQKQYVQPSPSPIEISFWETAKPLIPELKKEVWIDKKYRVDFLIPSKKIIIELYGYQHHNTKQQITKDAKRERYLQQIGYQVIRFTGTEVFKDVKKCVYETITFTNIETEKKFSQDIKDHVEKRPAQE